MLFTIVLSIFAGVLVNVHCEKNIVDVAKRVGFIYLIPLSEPIYLNAENNENDIDSNNRKFLPLPKLILALAPAVEDEKALLPGESIKTGEEEVPPTSPEARSKRSPGGGGCNRCGYKPSGGGGSGGGGSGGGGKGGGGGGSWSQSSASSSSGGWGGGGGKYHGRK